MSEAKAMAQRAADLGADALLVHPPVAFRDRPDPDALVLELSFPNRRGRAYPSSYSTCTRTRVASPIDPNVLVELLARSEVLGIKVATLDSVMHLSGYRPPAEKPRPTRNC